jgi:formate--tetrahydrofolate ligase
MKDAVLPNLVQTLEGTPAIVHGGPFANIAHGCNSVIATKTAMQLGEYVLTEAGFGSDLGAEKFFNIKCRKAGLTPALSVLVVTLQSLKLHGEVPLSGIKAPDANGIRKGMRNAEKHIRILQSFGQTVLVILNRFGFDEESEIEQVQHWCEEKGIPFAINNAFAEGGAGTMAAAEKIVELTREEAPPVQFTYETTDTVEEKIRKIVTRIYGATDFILEKKARQHLKRINKLGFAHLPVCIAKTQYSFTDNPDDLHTYEDFIISVDDLIINAGAGFIVAVCGEMVRMPGLPQKPSALNIDVVNGEVTGLG